MRGGRSFEGRGGLILIKRGAGEGEGEEGTGGAGQFVRGNYKYFLWGREGNVAGGPGAGGEGFRSHRCRVCMISYRILYNSYYVLCCIRFGECCTINVDFY